MKHSDANRQTPPTRIFLVGMMGSGKSTLGRLIAAHFAYDFTDTDDWIVCKTGKQVEEIFRDGEHAFRSLEREALNFVLQQDSVVVSTGGGLPCHFDNLDVMRDSGLVVYLDVPPDLLVERLSVSRTARPMLGDSTDLAARVSTLLAARKSFYDRAHCTVQLGKDSRETNARRIIEVIEEWQHK